MEKRISKRAVNGLSRREFLTMTTLATAGLVTGCAINPVTGKSQIMMINESEEITIDHQQSPHQLSSDYGATRDVTLGNYIRATGTRMAALTHRPGMPYAFYCVNANYINAYAFPGGTIACTRGILLEMDNEAELAALLGHELGHVNARHTASRVSKSQLSSIAVSGLSILASATVGSDAGSLAGQLGQLGAGAFLASYSRDNERQADGLGMEYMTRAGYSPQGMVDLMDMLNTMNQQKTGITQLLFSTHPMSTERYTTAVQKAQKDYSRFAGNSVYRERYMDSIAGLRKIKDAVKAQQNGEEAMGRKAYGDAEALFKQSLNQVPNDYTGLLLMAKCQLIQGNHTEAASYVQQAKRVNPKEAQAYHISGITCIRSKQYSAAYTEFSTYQSLLPGNPNTTFYQGLALEGMNQLERAASAYNTYLKSVSSGDQAKYAYNRLKSWGYIR
ncbi:M48 family metalloprotease [Desulfosarcina sp. OttesenSCG-928-A07]|nr:M48 family metalloprotease [Desulfosarcina sp. OttesenSCG-928-G17]MDL2328861.1 M48 family metalloprotease [Desulfosarcina sp. OttesenSCG-928-A07]